MTSTPDPAAAALPTLSGPRLRRALLAGIAAVTDARAALDKADVFPLPDGDTGTNLMLTLRGVAVVLQSSGSNRADEMLRAAAKAAMIDAHGKSGHILARFLRGFAAGLPESAPQLTAEQFARAAQSALDGAYSAVNEPRKGTILSVMLAWSEHLDASWAEAADPLMLLYGAQDAAQAALKRTPDELPVLKAAGVVDAGGQGFVTLLDGMIDALAASAESAADEDLAPLPLATADDEEEDELGHTFMASPCRYRVRFSLTGRDLDADAIRAQLVGLGEQVRVTGAGAVVKIRLYTDLPDKVFALANQLGTPAQEQVDDVRRQSAALNRDRKYRVAIVTDSAVSLPPGYADENGIQIVPLRIAFGSETYIDGVTMSIDSFYEKLLNSPHHPKTSQPPPDDFRRAYELVSNGVEGIISLHLGSGVSGTVKEAERVARELNAQPGATPIEVIDTGIFTVGQGLLVMAAVSAIKRGLGLAEVVATVRAARHSLVFYVYFDTLDYLVKGGRVSKTRSIIADLLKLRPIMTVDETGKPVPVAKTRGGEAGPRKVLSLIDKAVQGKRGLQFAVAHAQAPEAAAACVAAIRERYGREPILVAPVAPLLAVHTGPGAVAVAVFSE